MTESGNSEMLLKPQKVRELKKATFVFLMLLGYNRIVSKKHVKVLMASVRDKGCFLYPIKYITAKEYFKFYPDRKITLPSGEVITKDSDGLDKILFILDGQHRYTADEELNLEKGYQSTLMAEHVNLPDGMTPDEWMTTVNETSINWNERDRAGFIIALNPKDETNVSVVRQLRNDYKISERYGYALLNFSDNYRKAYYVEYMKHPQKELHFVLKGTPENRKRGLETLHAIEVGFRNHPKAIQNMAIINFVIEIYNDTPDIQKENIVKALQLFFMALPEKTTAEISETNDKSHRVEILKKAWKKFQKQVKQADENEKIMDITTNAEREWTAMMETSKKKTNHKQIQ